MSADDAPRLQVLEEAVRREGGEWTTRPAGRTYRQAGLVVPKRATWRADLKHLARSGLLTLRTENPNRRFYTRKDDAR